jgi:ATP phosphoribosyltransferase
MKSAEQRVKIALQKSGRLTDQSLDLLERCGLKFTKSRDQLFCHGENMPVDLLLVRDDDIPGLVGDDICELGIVGLNVIEEKRLDLEQSGEDVRFDQLRTLDFGHCRLVIAAPAEREFNGLECLQNSRIATSYVALLTDFLQRENIEAQVVYFSGAVEIAPRLGKADIICDLVSTGATLAANQLREIHTVLDSQASFILTRADISPFKQEWIDKISQRLEGVLQVRESKYIMLHAPRSALPEIRRLLPGSESPTVIPLDGNDDKVAVHAVCRETVFWETLENLKSAGASSLLVLPVEKMLA